MPDFDSEREIIDQQIYDAANDSGLSHVELFMDFPGSSDELVNFGRSLEAFYYDGTFNESWFGSRSIISGMLAVPRASEFITSLGEIGSKTTILPATPSSVKIKQLDESCVDTSVGMDFVTLPHDTIVPVEVHVEPQASLKNLLYLGERVFKGFQVMALKQGSGEERGDVLIGSISLGNLKMLLNDSPVAIRKIKPTS